MTTTPRRLLLLYFNAIAMVSGLRSLLTFDFYAVRCWLSDLWNHKTSRNESNTKRSDTHLHDLSCAIGRFIVPACVQLADAAAEIASMRATTSFHHSSIYASHVPGTEICVSLLFLFLFFCALCCCANEHAHCIQLRIVQCAFCNQ